MLATLSVAGVAQLVEHHLAKVAVESSNLFARSIFDRKMDNLLREVFLYPENGGELRKGELSESVLKA